MRNEFVHSASPGFDVKESADGSFTLSVRQGKNPLREIKSVSTDVLNDLLAAHAEMTSILDFIIDGVKLARSGTLPLDQLVVH